MTRFRPRFTLRWLMVAVALVAMGYGVQLAWQLRQYCLPLAADYAVKENSAREFGRLYAGRQQLQHWINTPKGSWRIRPENAEYYGRMRRKYERVARFPWLPIEPNPPEPDGR